ERGWALAPRDRGPGAGMYCWKGHLCRLKAVCPMEDLDRMDGMDSGTVLDLPPARLAVAGSEVCIRFTEQSEERLADGHRDLVLLLFQAVGAGDAAAVRVELDRPQLRHEREKVERRLADAVALLLARCVVGHRQLQRPEVGAQLALLVQEQQELAEVVHHLADPDDVL